MQSFNSSRFRPGVLNRTAERQMNPKIEINANSKYMRKSQYDNRFIDKFLPAEDFNAYAFTNFQPNNLTLKSPIKVDDSSNKRLTKEEIKYLSLENKLKMLEQRHWDDQSRFARLANSALTAPVNQLVHYHHVREEEEADRKEIEMRRERTRKELKKAQDQLRRELEFSSDEDNEKVDFKTKMGKLDKKLKKQLGNFDKYPQRPGNEPVKYDYYGGGSDINIESMGGGIERRGESEVDKALYDIRYMTNDYQLKLDTIRTRENKKYYDMYADMMQTNKDLMIKLSNYEHKNLMTVEIMRDMFENSGSNRLKYLSKRVLGGEDVEEEPVKEIDNLVNAVSSTINIFFSLI